MENAVGDVSLLDDLVAKRIDLLSLLIEDIVVLKHVLSRLEVVSLNVLLCLFHNVGEDLGILRKIAVGILQQGCRERRETAHSVVTEETHNIIGQRDIEGGCTRVALTSRTAAKLIIDSS